jgi:hypothetical protein
MRLASVGSTSIPSRSIRLRVAGRDRGVMLAEKLLGRKPEGTLEQSAARTSSWYQETRERPGTEAPDL